MGKLTRDPLAIHFKREVRAILVHHLRDRERLDVTQTQILIEELQELTAQYQIKLGTEQYETAFEIASYLVETAMDIFEFGDNSYGDGDQFFVAASQRFLEIWEMEGLSDADKPHLFGELLELIEDSIFEDKLAYRVELLEIAAQLANFPTSQKALLALIQKTLDENEDQTLIKLAHQLLVGLALDTEDFLEKYLRKSEYLRRWSFNEAKKNKRYQKAYEMAKIGYAHAKIRDKNMWKKALDKATYDYETDQIYNNWTKTLAQVENAVKDAPMFEAVPQSLADIQNNPMLVENCPPELAQNHPREIFQIYSDHLFRTIAKGSPAVAAQKLLACQQVLAPEPAASLIKHMKKTFAKKKKFMEELERLEGTTSKAAPEIKSLF